MTVVGKILTFMVLLFSVFTSALIVIVFSTRTNWKIAHDKNRELALIATAAYKSEKDSHESDLKILQERSQTLQDAVNKLTESKLDLEKQIATHNDEKTRLTSLNKSTEDKEKLLEAEVKRLREEREAFAKRENDLQARHDALIKQYNDQKVSTAQAENKTRESERRADQILRDLERTNRELAELRASGGTAVASGGTGSVLKPPPPPAPKNIRAEVTAVGQTGLAQISVGADSGLQVGNELFIVRFDLKDTTNSQFVGVIRLSRVDPKAAVGQFEPSNSRERIKIGDQVLSSLGGK
jgi:hypothetical protein